MLRGSSAFGAFIPDQYLANYVKKMGIAKYWLKKNIARWNRIGMALVFWIFSRSLRCAMMHAHILHKFLLNESSNFFLDCFLLETHFRGIPYMKNHGMAYAFEKSSQWKGSRLRWCSVIYGSMLGKGLMDKQTCFFFFSPTQLIASLLYQYWDSCLTYWTHLSFRKTCQLTIRLYGIVKCYLKVN